MNTKDLEYFAKIVEEKSISKASKVLYISPQGLSKSLKRLEDEFGTILIDRSTQEFLLTETGKAVLEYAKKLQESTQKLREEIHEIEQKSKKEVDILSAFGIIRFLSPDCIVDFQKMNPDIDFQYHEYPDKKVEDYFEKGYGNIAFTIGGFTEEQRQKYEIIELGAMPIKLLVYDGHPLASKTFARIEDLKDEPIYIENKAFKINHIIREKCLKAGFEPNIIFETAGFSLCHKMVKQEKGISVTIDFVFSDMKEDNLVKIPFWEEDLQWKICLLKRKDEEMGEGVETFINYIDNEIKKRM